MRKTLRKTLLALAIIIGFSLFTSPRELAAQSLDVTPDFAGGVGFVFLGEEDQTFSTDALFGVFHWNGLKLPGPNVSTGVGIEFHPTTINLEGNTIANVDYRIWSLNRFDCPAALYCGADMQIGKGGDGGYQGDFDLRIVTGLRIAGIGDTAGEVNLEMYFLEDDRPIGVAVIVRWGGSNN